MAEPSGLQMTRLESVKPRPRANLFLRYWVWAFFNSSTRLEPMLISLIPAELLGALVRAIFSDDGKKRYLLHKVWDADKPTLAIVMLAPSEASGVEMDNTTVLVLNNALRLGYGGVYILNLFATLGDFTLKQAEDEDAENLQVIVQMAEKADAVVYAPGVGKAKSKIFQKRQEQVLVALQPFEGKLNCLCDGNGDARLQHPLSPAVRTWYLSPLKIRELLPKEESPTGPAPQEKQKKKGRPKAEKKEENNP